MSTKGKGKRAGFRRRADRVRKEDEPFLFSFQMTVGMHKQLEEIALGLERSMAWVCREACATYIETLRKKAA